MLAIRAVGAALVVLIRRFPTLLMANVTASLINVPVGIIVLIAVPGHTVWIALAVFAVLVGILPNPGAAGMQYLVFQFFNTPILVSIWDQFDGLREYFRAALKLWLVAVPVTSLLALNILFYGRTGLIIAPLLQGIMAAALFVWVGIQFYLYPLLMTQEDTSVWTTYRNAAVLTLGRPVTTLAGVLIWLWVLALGTASGLLFVLGLAAAATIQQSITKNVVTQLERRTPPTDALASSESSDPHSASRP